VRILDAAERLLRTMGLARTTTKEIAWAAGCSEAALYKHYGSKEEIFVRVLHERLPRILPLLAQYAAAPEGRPVREQLAEIARHAVLFYESTTPIGASLFAEPALLARHREELRKMDQGPETLLRALVGYLHAERSAGRIRADADIESAAAALLGACFQRAFLTCFWEERPALPLDDFSRAISRTVFAVMRP
jgi:AcrR family transcriptional regulator